MKVLCYLCCALCLCVFSLSAQASSFSKDIFASDISLNMASSVQTDAVKYASVNFISRRSNIKMNDVSEGDNLDESPINKIECPAGQENVGGICTDVNACTSSFTLLSASKTVGTYVTKNCGSKGIRYCYTSCQSGWTHSGCSCTPVDCSEYPLSTNKNQNCNGLKSCKTGDTYKYKCTSCALGYKLNNNTCIAKNCSDYSTMYATSVTAHCTAIVAGKAGEGYCYDCTGCEDGWTLSNTHTCTVNTCNYKTSSITNCIKHTITRTGTDLCYECTECELGYSLNGGHTTCTANSCPTGSSTSFSTVQNCTAVSVTKAGTNFCYKCSN